MGNNGTWDGARVVVTGGGRGIGRAVADGFASGGGRVIVADSDPAAAEGSDHAIVLADISSQTEVVALFEAVERRLGGLDVLVNNAGISGPAAPLQEIDPADWDRVIAVNLTGQFLCARAAIPLMLSGGGGGSIVNIASTAGLFGYPDRSPYAASKFGVIGLTKTLAMELGTQGIRVNAVCPGTVSVPRMDRVIEAEAEANREEGSRHPRRLHGADIHANVHRGHRYRRHGAFSLLPRFRASHGTGHLRRRQHRVAANVGMARTSGPANPICGSQSNAETRPAAPATALPRASTDESPGNR